MPDYSIYGCVKGDIMAEARCQLTEIRERMVLGRSLAQQLADLALLAPPSLAAQLETIAVMTFECVSRTLADVTAMLDSAQPAALAA